MTSVVSAKTPVEGVKFYILSVELVSGYVWIGGSVDTDANTPLYNSPYYTDVVPWRGMVGGKRFGPDSIVMAIRNIPYVSGVVYDMYDDQDPDLVDKNFYVMVSSGSFRHCFKCLDNDNGSVSTVPPSMADVDSADEVYQTSDGYRWKYMYSITEAMADDFYYDGFVPLVANASVAAEATAGSIEIIRVDDPGRGYDNYLTGTFSSSDLRVGGNATVYSIGSNTLSSTANGFYTGCVFYVTTGSAADQWRTVRDHYANSSGRYIVLDSELTVPPTGTSSWRIDPQVVVTGTGVETVMAHARALVNASSSNSVYRVEMLDVGLGYQYATAQVVANDAVSVSAVASVRPINAPPGGHGANPPAELYCSSDLVSVKITADEANTLPPSGSFASYGILTGPMFSNVSIDFSSSNGSFVTGEKLIAFTKKRLDDGLAVSYGSPYLTGSNTHLDEQLTANDWVYIVSSDNQNHHLDVVGSVVNSDAAVLASNVLWSCTDVTVYAATVVDTGTIIGSTGNTVHVTGTPMNFYVAGDVSTYPNGGWGIVSSIKSGGVTKNNATFNQTLRIVGDYVEGTYSEGELLYQGDSVETATSSGYLFSQSSGDHTTLFLTMTTGHFYDTRLKGADSGVLFTITDKYQPELVPGSGNVLYVQNIDPVARVKNQSIVLNFMVKFF